MTASALLVLNRSAGTGHAERFATDLVGAFRAGHRGAPEVDVSVVDNHRQARAAASGFASRAPRRSIVVAAGGGGTLRAVIEGVMDVHATPPEASVLRFAALRMGSGNVIARRVAMPLDPIEGARQVGEGFARGRSAFCTVMRCTHGAEDGRDVVRHAVTMCGLGAWGRVPGDVARWRAAHPDLRTWAAGWAGLERVNTGEYLAFGTARMLAATVSAGQCDLVDVEGGSRLRLLAAAALTGPLPPLPDPGLAPGDVAAVLTVMPRFGSPYRLRLEPGRPFELRLVDRESIEFFLDEDPEIAYDWLKLEVPGRLAFVPGRES